MTRIRPIIQHGYDHEIARVLAGFVAEPAPRLSGPAANLFAPEDLARLRSSGSGLRASAGRQRYRPKS
ncbi:hypothetical protein AB0I35_16235 [Nocardia sp. NPDC050378]|uniref:hypothetical protein n=1 Tax=Nocardia sp. NPDC050378 TaxID=3155400 RepID=UPI0033EF0631